MKKVLIALSALLVAGAGVTTASAQVRDRDRDGIPNRADKHPSKPRWAKGQRLDARYRTNTYVITDYGRRGWRAPPRGHAYYRTDEGVVLAAVATGVIASVVASAVYD